MPTTAQFTPTEARIFALLEDGYPHTRKEIFERCIEDDLANPNGIVKFHICSMRRKLKGSGEDITCSIAYNRTSYRRVMLVGKARDEDLDEEGCRRTSE